MNKQEELTRFYMSNTALKDFAGNVDKSALKDWNNQVRQMTLALESATNGLVKVIKTIDEQGNALATFDVLRSQKANAQPAFERVLANIEGKYDYQAGSLLIDPYGNGLNQTENYRRITFHKVFHGAIAQKTAKEAVAAVGGTAVLDPSKTMKDRMRIDFAVSEAEWDKALQNADGDVSKANLSLSGKFIRRNLKQAEKYSDDIRDTQKEKEAAKDTKQKEREAKAAERQREKEAKAEARQKEREEKEAKRQREREAKEEARQKLREARAEARQKDKEEKEVKAAEKQKAKKEEKEAKEAERQKVKKEKEAEQQKRKEEREDKAEKRQIRHWLGVVAMVLVGIADTVRRILTASLERASEIKKEQIEAKSVGISYANAREYKAQETAMGLKEGSFMSAITSLQSAFGDVTHLDDSALGELAKVLKGDVVDAINSGLGRNDPESLMKTILDTYFERGQAGINSIGQQVGQYQAERELATALEKAGLNDLANILRNMFYTNDTGIYKGLISANNGFADYMGLVTAYTMGFGSADNKRFAELGAVVDNVKTKFELLKDNLEKLVLVSISGLINKIDNWDIGMSEKDKTEQNALNIKLNSEARDKMKNLAETSLYSANTTFSGIDFSSFGEGATFATVVEELNKTGWDTRKLNGAQKETYNAMVQLARTDKGKEAIYALITSQIAAEKSNQADTAIIEGRKKGDVKYNKTAYTDATIQSEVEDSISEFYDWQKRQSITGAGYNINGFARHNIAALGLLNKSNDYSNASMYDQISYALYGGNKLTYEDALASKKANNLTNALYDKLPKSSKAKGNILGFVSMNKKEEAVKNALASGILSENDVYTLMSENVSEGWGFTNDQITNAKALFNENDATAAGEVTAVNNVLSEALSLDRAKDYLAKYNAEGVTATIGGYSENNGGRVEVVLSVKDDKNAPKEILSFNTDSVLGENQYYNIDLADMINSAQNRRATR